MFRFFRKKPRSDQAEVTPKPSLSPLDQALQEGDYQTAIALIDAEVTVATDVGKLFMAFELRVLVEEFDAAEADLDRIMQLDPGCGLHEELGPLLRDVRVWHDRQTLPDYSEMRSATSAGLPPYLLLLLGATHFHANGQIEAARNAVTSAKEQMPRIAGTLYHLDGRPIHFAHLTDSDDLTGPLLVCSTAQGIFDIPFEHIDTVDFAPRQGFPGELWNVVRVFAYYVGTGRHESGPVRRLNRTVWDNKGGYAVAYGQRDLRYETRDGKYVGLTGINQVSRLVFHRSSA